LGLVLFVKTPSGTRWHQVGCDHDLSDAEFQKLPEGTKAKFEAIFKPGDAPVGYEPATKRVKSAADQKVASEKAMAAAAAIQLSLQFPSNSSGGSTSSTHSGNAAACKCGKPKSEKCGFKMCKLCCTSGPGASSSTSCGNPNHEGDGPLKKEKTLKGQWLRLPSFMNTSPLF
jgi:hypothetical protein